MDSEAVEVADTEAELATIHKKGKSCTCTDRNAGSQIPDRKRRHTVRVHCHTVCVACSLPHWSDLSNANLGWHYDRRCNDCIEHQSTAPEKCTHPCTPLVYAQVGEEVDCGVLLETSAA